MMGYEEHLNYQVLRSADQQFNKCVMRIVVTRERQQVIQVGVWLGDVTDLARLFYL